MKRFSLFSLLVTALVAALVSLNACKKEVVQNTLPEIKDGTPVSSRSQVTYGVEVYTGGAPSQIIEMDNNNGNVTNIAPQAFYIDNAGNTINLDNLKGICLTSWGQYFITTGNPVNPGPLPAAIYSDALYKVNPVNGQSSYASTCPFGTISDLEHDLATSYFYGLLDNSNAIVEIQDNANNYGTYLGPFAITGIAPGYTLKGLAQVRDVNGLSFVGCATRAGAPTPAKLYQIPANGGAATFLTDLDPVADMAGGHCGIGFDVDFNQLLINRGPFSTLIPGLNILKWNIPLAPVSLTGNWGGLGFDFEDLTSDVQ